ncbi:MAG: hypothetical protein EXR43_02870 [Dehalococcoidia bacterium]|nr:hypothetical protein [Dehalococcoidia bacterium]
MTENGGRPPPALSVSEEAAQRIRGDLTKRNLSNAVLRVVFHIKDQQPRHGLIPEPKAKLDDIVIRQHGVTFVIDPQTLPLIRGSYIYCDATDPASEIEVENPNIRIRDDG